MNLGEGDTVGGGAARRKELDRLIQEVQRLVGVMAGPATPRNISVGQSGRALSKDTWSARGGNGGSGSLSRHHLFLEV